MRALASSPTYGSRGRRRRWTTSAALAVGLTGLFATVLATPAQATVPISTLIGLGKLETGAPASGAEGLLMAYGVDPDAPEIVSGFTVGETGSIVVDIPARDSLVTMARANGDRLNLFLGATKVIGEGDAQQWYRLSEYTEATLTSSSTNLYVQGTTPEFHAPDYTTYVFQAVGDARSGSMTFVTPDEPGVVIDGGLVQGEPAVGVAATYSQPMSFALDPTGLTTPVYGDATSTVYYTRDNAASSVTDVYTKTAALYTARAAVAPMNPSAAVAQAGSSKAGNCVLTGSEIKKKAIKAYPPVSTPKEWSTKGMDIGFTSHAYQSDMARPLVGVGYTWQVEICTIGGAQVFAGYRLRMVGTGTTSEEDRQSRLDASWESGRDIPTVEATLYAHVGSENDPVQVGGSLSQKATGVNGGSRDTRGPVKNPAMDKWKHNMAIGTWKAVCGGLTTFETCGSRDYQGVVLNTLFEWPRSEVDHANLLVGFYVDRQCTKTWSSCPK